MTKLYRHQNTWHNDKKNIKNRQLTWTEFRIIISVSLGRDTIYMADFLDVTFSRQLWWHYLKSGNGLSLSCPCQFRTAPHLFLSSASSIQSTFYLAICLRFIWVLSSHSCSVFRVVSVFTFPHQTSVCTYLLSISVTWPLNVRSSDVLRRSLH